MWQFEKKYTPEQAEQFILTLVGELERGWITWRPGMTVRVTDGIAEDHVSAIKELLDVAEKPRNDARREAAREAREAREALAGLSDALRRVHGIHV